MWVRRATIDELKARAARVPELEKTAALLQQHVDWLVASTNRLEAERALLIQRLFAVNLPAARIDVVRPISGIGVQGAPLTDDAREPVAGIDTGVLQIGAAAFEDMGDQEAERQGIGRSEPIVALR